jgi:phage-related protein
MNWTISYYNEKVRKQVFDIPIGIVAAYVRLTDAMVLYGADLRMPHSRPMGGGLLELRPKGQEGIGRVFYCTHRWAGRL